MAYVDSISSQEGKMFSLTSSPNEDEFIDDRSPGKCPVVLYEHEYRIFDCDNRKNQLPPLVEWKRVLVGQIVAGPSGSTSQDVKTSTKSSIALAAGARRV